MQNPNTDDLIAGGSVKFLLSRQIFTQTELYKNVYCSQMFGRSFIFNSVAYNILTLRYSIIGLVRHQ